MIKKPIRFSKEFFRIFTEKRLARGAAALSYYLTMTFFPLIICLYTLLGNNYESAQKLLEMSRSLIAFESYEAIGDFLQYVAKNNDQAMMIASILILVTSASAAIRSAQLTIGDMQGGQRYKGLTFIWSSVLFSAAFVAAVYFSVLIILAEDKIMGRLAEWLPIFGVSQSWNATRFLLMGVIDAAMLIGLYEMSKRRDDHYSTLPGAVVASVALSVVGVLFSTFLSRSVRYPLVYGSLASLILLMFWLYISCIAILCGAAINVAYRNFKQQP